MKQQEMFIRSLADGSLLIHAPSISWLVSEDSAELYKADLNLSYVEKEEKRIRIDRKFRRINQFELHLSDRCNMRCLYCYVPNKHRKKSPIMSVSTAKTILKKIMDFGTNEGLMPNIHFHGGEPALCISTIKKLIDEFKDDFCYTIQTNGTVMTDNDLLFLVKNNVEIGVSIDTVDDENNIVRIGCSTKRVIDTIKTLVRIRTIPPTIIITVTNQNLNSILDTIKYLYEIGIYSITLNPVLPYTTIPSEIIPDEDELIDRYLECVNYALFCTRKNPSHPLFINNMESFALSIISSRSSSYCEMAPCGAGRHIAVIDSWGNLFPCSGLMSNMDFCCGNVLEKDNSIEKLLNSAPVRSFQERDVYKIRECSGCPYIQICGANCPIPYVNSGKSLLYPSPWCKLRKSLIDFIFNEAIGNPSLILDFICYETQASLVDSKTVSAKQLTDEI